MGRIYRASPDQTGRKLKFDNFHENYRTVVSEVHHVNPAKDRQKTLIDLCQQLTDPTIIFSLFSGGVLPKWFRRLFLGVNPEVKISVEAADWVAANYHPDWHFVKVLRKGIGVHHGRIPRALAHYVVSAFNKGSIRFLVCIVNPDRGCQYQGKERYHLRQQN